MEQNISHVMIEFGSRSYFIEKQYKEGQKFEVPYYYNGQGYYTYKIHTSKNIYIPLFIISIMILFYEFLIKKIIIRNFKHNK